MSVTASNSAPLASPSSSTLSLSLSSSTSCSPSSSFSPSSPTSSPLPSSHMSSLSFPTPSATKSRCRATRRKEPWLLLLWCHLSQVLAGGLLRSLAVFLDDILDEFNSSVALVGWIFSLEAFFFGLTCPFASFATKRLGPRFVMMIGGVVNGGGILMASLATNIVMVGAGMSMIAGIGSSMIYASALVTVRRNFREHYAIANGLTLAGVSVAVFVFPPVIRVLIDIFGWRGALAILSAFSLNATVTGSIIKDAHGERKRRASTISRCDLQLQYAKVPVDSERHQERDEFNKRNIHLSNGLCPCRLSVAAEGDPHNYDDFSIDDHSLNCHRRLFYADSQKMPIKSVYKKGSVSVEPLLLNGGLSTTKPDELFQEGNNVKGKCAWFFLDNVVHGLLCVAVILWAASNTAVMKYLSAAGVQRGFTSIQGAMLLSATGVAQCVCLFTSGIIVSRGWLKALHFHFLVLLLMAGAEFGLAFFQHYAVGLVFAALFGLGSGTVLSLNLVVQRTLDRRAGVQAAGFLMFIDGFAGCIGGLGVGAVRDASGNYTLSFITTGLMTSLGALVVLIIIAIRRLDTSGQKTVHVTDEP